MPQTFAERLAGLIEADPRSKTQIAADAGVNRQVLTDILSGRIPGGKHVASLAKALRVDAGWLATGDLDVLAKTARELQSAVEGMDRAVGKRGGSVRAMSVPMNLTLSFPEQLALVQAAEKALAGKKLSAARAAVLEGLLARIARHYAPSDDTRSEPEMRAWLRKMAEDSEAD